MIASRKSSEKNKYHSYRESKVVRYIDSIKSGLRVFPPSLQIGLTDHCFNRCITCGHWKRSEKHSINKYHLLDLLNSGKSKGLETVCYSGGDPFAYPYTNEIMEWHLENDVDFGFIASGYIPPSIDNSLLSHARWVRVSLDAYGKADYSICRGGVDFDKVMKSLHHMLSSVHSVNVELGITIHKFNWDKLRPLLEYAADNYIKNIRFWVARHEDSIKPPANDLRHVLVDHLAWANKEELNTNIEDTLTIMDNGDNEYSGLEFDSCYACLFQAFVAPDSSVYPCCIIAGDTEASSHLEPIGNISGGEFPWHAAKNFNASKLPEICKTGCITRLITVNHFASKHWHDKHFI